MNGSEKWGCRPRKYQVLRDRSLGALVNMFKFWGSRRVPNSWASLAYCSSKEGDSGKTWDLKSESAGTAPWKTCRPFIFRLQISFWEGKLLPSIEHWAWMLYSLTYLKGLSGMLSENRWWGCALCFILKYFCFSMY